MTNHSSESAEMGAAAKTPRKFWMVVRHDGNNGHGPTKRHETREAAEAEAQRLVEKERSIFYVLEAVSKHHGDFSHARTELAA